jgi:histidyl-tRNA synthetase
VKYASVKGMEDILPPDSRLWQRLESAARADLESRGYSEIRTPILEDTAVFVRGIGETTDIVSKEMYTFTDRKDRSLTLRPEGTAPIARAYVEHALNGVSPVQRLYYIGPMFRAERPQKGRSRQFHQIGVEVIGSSSPFADAEVIAQLAGMLKAFGLSGYRIKLNSLGCADDKAKYAGNLREYLSGKSGKLCEECVARARKNVLRVLDCKNEGCASVVRDAPDVSESLCGKCGEHFGVLKGALSALGIKFDGAKNLVRGLDYYTGTVFELTHPALGSQDAIGAGGRYDNLVSDMGGPAVGAVGYAVGIERIIMALGTAAAADTAPSKLVYIAALDGRARIEGMKLADRIRAEIPGVTVLQDITGSSLKSQMRSAGKNGAGAVLILGEEEMRLGNVALKMMDNSEPQSAFGSGAIIEELRRRIC